MQDNDDEYDDNLESLTSNWETFYHSANVNGSEGGRLSLEETCFDAEALDFLTKQRQQQEQPLLLTWIHFYECRFVEEAAIGKMKDFLLGIDELQVLNVEDLGGDSFLIHRQALVMLLEVASHACPHLQRVELNYVDLRGTQIATLLQELFLKQPSLHTLDLYHCRMDDQAHAGVSRGIATRDGGGVQSLSIISCEVNDARMQALVDAFCGNRASAAALRQLSIFARGNLSSTSLPALVQLLAHCQELQELRLNGSRIFDAAAAVATAHAVTGDQCPLYDSFLETVQAHPSLQTLNLGWCGINKFMAAPLFAMLERNTTLQSLDLRNHTLSSDVLAQSVHRWKGLSTLTLALDQEESLTLQRALAQNASLTHIHGGLERHAFSRRIMHRNRWLRKIQNLFHHQNSKNNELQSSLGVPQLKQPRLGGGTSHRRRRRLVQACYWPFLVERLMKKVEGDVSVLYTFVLATEQELFA